MLVVDDDALVRAGLSMLLAGAEDIAIVGEAADGSEVAHAVAEHEPDVVLMDIRMPGMDGLAATELLRAHDRAPEVIVLTTFEADDDVLRALRAGASGFLLKDTPPADIVARRPGGRGRRADALPDGHPPADRPRDRRRGSATASAAPASSSTASPSASARSPSRSGSASPTPRSAASST